MSTLTTTIRAENRFSGTMQQLATEAARIRRSIVEGNKQSAQSYESFGKTLSKVAQNTRKSWQECAVGLKSTIDLAKGAFSQFQDVYRQFARFEDAATRLAPLVGGLESAKNLCRALRDEAANGTMSFEQLTSIAGRLSAVFSSTDDIARWVSVFHNISAGTGLDINELVGNFAKLKAAGRVTGEFPEMFAQKGVNIFGALAEQTGKTAAELRKMAQEGTLSFAEIEKALLSVATGSGQFAGQAAAMSNTFGGSIGTMMANLDTLKAEFAEPIAERLTPTIQRLAVSIRECADKAEMFGAAIFAVAKIAAPLVGVYAAFKSVMAAVNTTRSLFGGLFAFTKSGFAQMTADAQKAAAATASVGNAAAGASGKVKGLITAGAGLTALVGIVAQIGVTAYLSYLEDCTSAAEKLNQTHRRLQESMDKMSSAKSAEEFDRAKKNAEALGEVLALNQAKWQEDAGMAPTKFNAEVLGETIAALRERKASEWKEAAASQASKAREDAVAPLREEYKKLSDEQKAKAAKAEIENASVEDLPNLLLKQAGYESADALRTSVEQSKLMLESALAWGDASKQQVEQYRQMTELLEKVETAEQKLAEHKAEQQAKADEAQKNYERQKKLLEAELSGSEEQLEKVRADNRYEDLVEQFTAAGMDESTAARAASEISALEAAKREQEREQKPARSPSAAVGSGLIASEQASVGGGRSIQIGRDGLVDLSRRQLDMLSRIEKNTGAEKTISGDFRLA